jgi:hypothetical protein
MLELLFVVDLTHTKLRLFVVLTLVLLRVKSTKISKANVPNITSSNVSIRACQIHYNSQLHGSSIAF